MKIERVRPGPGQESVWDYPRPPKLEPCSRRIQIVFGGITLVDTLRAQRVLETSHPPVYCIPREDIRMEHLRPAAGSSFCEWKGWATYFEALGLVVLEDERSLDGAIDVATMRALNRRVDEQGESPAAAARHLWPAARGTAKAAPRM